MQRSGDDEKDILTAILSVVAVLLYEPFTTIYPFLPPLFGLAFWNIYAARHISTKLLWLGYFYLYEVDHNIFGFALLVTVVLTYLLAIRISKFLLCGVCLKIVLTTLFYLIFVALLNFLSYIFNINYTFEWIDIVYYLIIDIVIVAYAT